MGTTSTSCCLSLEAVEACLVVLHSAPFCFRLRGLSSVNAAERFGCYAELSELRNEQDGGGHQEPFQVRNAER